MGKLGCLGGTLPDRKFIYHACLLLLHWQDALLIRSQTEHSNWICNCPLRDTVTALLCSLIIIQSKLVVDKVIIMTIRRGSIPCKAPGVLFCDVGCQNGLPATRGEQNQGRAKVFTGSINRMEVPLYRERNPGPQETGQITGLSSAPCTCFDCNVLCFLLGLLSPSFHGSPRCQLSWTAQKQCCAVVVWAPSCAVGVLLLKFNLYTPVPPNPPPTYHTHIHTLSHTHYHVIITVVSPQLAHIHTPLTWIEDKRPEWTGSCYRMWLGIG